MARYTTFRYRLDPTVEQCDELSRHAGASRFAFNQCLRVVKSALTQRRTDSDTKGAWTGFDLINLFNAWKKTEAAGRVFAVDPDGVVEIVVTGLQWRREICQQVFEEAAVDLGRGLKAWSESRRTDDTGRRVGFPRFKKKSSTVPSFRLRNRQSTGKPSSVRVGYDEHPRSITLPRIGRVAVQDDTRRLRRMLTKGRAKILFVSVSHRGGRWWVSVTVEAAELHPGRRHTTRPLKGDGWIGVDRGLSAFVVSANADGTEVARITNAPRALAAGMKKQRRLSKSLSRKEKGSQHRKDVAARLRRHHHRVANVRRHFLHQVSNELVKTHDRLVIENLNVQGMLRNRRLVRAISDAGWSELAQMLVYKQMWRGGQLVEADRWYPSTRLCPHCGAVNNAMSLADRVFNCSCGHVADRDTNAAVNLARWGEANYGICRPPDPQAGGRVNNVRRRDGAGQHLRVGETSPIDVETDVRPAPAA